MAEESYTTHSSDETFGLGQKIGQSLSIGSVLCFFGELGAGKTTFIKGIIATLLGEDVPVSSPTFTYLNIYGTNPKIYHFDLYRLKDADQFLSMGFDEYFYDPNGICLVEWSEKISTLLPSHFIKVKMLHRGQSIREIKILT